MNAKLIIKKGKRGYFVEIDNGYGQALTLTDFVNTLEAAENLVRQFLNTEVVYDI